MSFVEHKFIEQVFGKVYKKQLVLQLFLWEIPTFRQILLQQNTTASFLTFVPVDE